MQGESSGISPAVGPTALESVGFENPTLVAFARQLLSPYRLGTVSLEVAEVADPAVPQMSMDESYALK